MNYPEEFKSVVRESYPDLAPLQVATSKDETYARGHRNRGGDGLGDRRAK